VTPIGDQGTFGQGVNFINLYLLGCNRTLTLVNGRRVVSSNVPGVLGNAAPGTPVDLHVIRAFLVDQVERVSIGGAPVCGSDAIAGTVNVVLKRKFEGLETRATSGISADGDNHRLNLATAGGLPFDGGRGNITTPRIAATATVPSLSGGNPDLRNERAERPNDAREVDHFGGFTTVDTALFVTTADFRFAFSVSNLFNRIGQKYYGYVIPLLINDPLGRRFAVSVAKNW